MEGQISELRARQLELFRNRQFAAPEFLQTRIRLSTLEAKLDAYEADGTPKLLAMGVRDRAVARDSELFVRGEVEKPGAIVPRGFVQVLRSAETPAISSGSGRLHLANWIASDRNPLTARVFVNRVWLHLFGRGLVPTPDNFGASGQRPSHPELLDWLAVEFMESGWSIKHLHRLIVTSDAYQRLSSASGNPSHQKDPENRWYWRMNAGRMEVEVLRDSILQLAGKLDPTMGGQELENKDIFTTWRRSLYYSCQPEEDGKSSLGMLFDGPDASDCYRRTRTVIPQQSLAMTNSPLVHELSPLIAQQIESRLALEALADSDRFVDAAYRTILGRSPSVQETELCRDYLSDTTQTQSLRASLVRVLLNHSDFITIR